MPEDTLFGDALPEPWEDEWQGMPEFKNKDITAKYSITVNFDELHHMLEFAKLVGQKITPRTKYINFPRREDDGLRGVKYMSDL